MNKTYYVVFDLEFNQYFSHFKEDKKDKEFPCPFEIIQIGAVLLDETLTFAGKFECKIKPEIFDTIHPYVKKITGITMESLLDSKGFKDVYSDFLKFIYSKGSHIVLCVWGTADIRELIRNIKYHDLSYRPLPLSFIDVQAEASKYLCCPKGISIGLEDAVELLTIPGDSTFHNAYNDAWYTSEVFSRIYDNDMKIEHYTEKPPKKKTTPEKK